MAQILFEHCQLRINEKVLVQYEKLYEFITSTLQFQISTYKPLIIEKYHVTQQDMLNIMETLKACIVSKFETDFTILPVSQKHSDPKKNTNLKCISNATSNIERTLVINSSPNKVVSHEEGFSKDDAEENMTSCKKIISKTKREVNARNFEQTSRKADPEEMSCLSGCKDMNNSESGCKGMNNSEFKAEAKVADVRKEATTNKLETQNASDICQVQGKSDKNQSEFTFNWPEDWQFTCAEWYMDTKFSRSFFNAAVRKDTQVTFRLSNNNPQVKLFIRLLQQLKFEKITFNDGNKQQAQRLAEQVMCKTSAKIKVSAGHFMIVGLKEEVSETKRMIMEKLQSQNKAKYGSSENICMQDENYMGRSRQIFSDEYNKVNRSKFELMHGKSSEIDNSHLKTTNLPASSSQRSHEQDSYQRVFQTESSMAQDFENKSAKVPNKICRKSKTKEHVNSSAYFDKLQQDLGQVTMQSESDLTVQQKPEGTAKNESSSMERPKQLVNDGDDHLRTTYGSNTEDRNESWYSKSSRSSSFNSKATTLLASKIDRNNDASSSHQGSFEQSAHYGSDMFFTEKSHLKVQIHQKDITKFKVDCIVNAANRRLQHHGGVAKAIAEAAGWDLKADCDNYIKKGKLVNVTEIFVSRGGKLPARIVLHAVGPMWSAYEDKDECLNHLRCTVLRCLVEAARQRMYSVALPSVSAAIFKVPKQLCAMCYLLAVKHFDAFNYRERSSLKEIHFIDIDVFMVNLIAECFRYNWNTPCDQNILHNDLKFAENHIRSTFSSQTSNYDFSKQTSSRSSSSLSLTRAKETTEEMRKSDTSISFHFGSVTLHVKSKPAFNYPADITITIGKPFDKLSGLADFRIEKNLKKTEKMPYRKNSYTFFNVTKPHGKQSRLLFAVFPEPDSVDAVDDSFRNLELAFQHPEIREIFAKSMNGLVITSSILYAEPNNNHQQKGSKTGFEKKKVGRFGDCLHRLLERVSREIPSTFITVAGSEDILPTIQRVMESRGVQSSWCNTPESQRSCGMTGSSGKSSGYHHQNDSQEKSTSSSKDVQNPGQNPSGCMGTSVDSQMKCKICLDEDKHCYPTSCCKNMICLECETRLSSCPFCRKFWQILKGNQPDGTMSAKLISDSADGYENFGTWKIDYYFPFGKQKDHHPNPVKPYRYLMRTAYIPDSDDGFQLLMLLRLAFVRRLTFTIGHSHTKNVDDVITWNDIHHKTSLHGGSFGYPDPAYILRAMTELADRGVTFDTMTEEEKYDLDKFHYRCKNFRFFYN